MALDYKIESQKFAGLGADVALLQTTDGVKMIDLWNEVISPALDAYNTVDNALASFMCYKSDLRMEQVVQTYGSAWQRNTEVTKGTSESDIRRFWIRTATNDFKKYMGYTKKFISKNSASHIVQMLDAQLKSLDNQKYQEILTAFFTKGARKVIDKETNESLLLPGFVDGTGNWPIPPNGTNTFDSTHTHFQFVDNSTTAWTNTTNRETTIKSLIRTVTEHGYRQNLLIMFNANMSDEISACPGYRQVVTLSPFVQSTDAALRGLDTQVNIKTFEQLAGLFRVIGTLDNATCMECDFLPSGYVAVFSYNGTNSADNPVQYIEFPVTSFSDNPFPFYETQFETEFGASVRKRLNGAILYVANGASAYVNPAFVGLDAVVGDWNGQ